MNLVSYIERESIPSIDLNVLGNTYNTLQQGHTEAVQAASDLKASIAKLVMNEEEDDFKQQLINEIQTTIDENTVYGNSYTALDDLIEQAGNIQSDGRVIGRLRNQAAKKEFDAKVDSMNISEGMKEMYKETNPYYYEEGDINPTTGKYMPGDIWKPNTTPVNTVPIADIQKYALSIASKDTGGMDTVMFLDKNGRPTTNPLDSVDGQIYKQVGSQWERLSEDKIAEAYKIAIDSIPGAEDSLKQDYNYAEWQREKLIDKNRKNGGDTTPYIEGLTDKEGNIYTYDQWLNNKIKGFSEVSAYNNTVTNVSYGTALQNYKASVNTNNQGTYSSENIDGLTNSGFGTFIAGTKEVEANSFAGAENAKLAANRQGINILQKLDKYKNINSIDTVINDLIDKGIVDSPQDAANYIIYTSGDTFTAEDRIGLTNAFTGYYQANLQMNKLLEAAGKDADGLRFSADVANNVFSNNNKYSKEIIDYLNDYYSKNTNAHFLVGSQILEGIAKKYNTDINGLKKLGFNIATTSDGNYDVKISANNRNLLPKFAYTIRQVDNEIPGTVGGWLKNKFTSGVASTNYYEYGVGSRTGDSPVRTSAFAKLSSIYEKGIKMGAKAEEKVGLSKGTITFHGFDSSSFGALYYRENADVLGLSESQLQSVIKRQDEQVDLAFANGQFDAGLIEELDKSGKAITNVKDAQDIKVLIQKMYANNSWRNQISRVALVPKGGGIGQPKGYKLTFTVPEEAETGKYKAGQLVNFVVSGILEEEINYDPSYNPTILASNSIQISKSTGSTIDNIGYNQNFGDTRLTPIGNDMYSTSFMGINKNLNEDEAEKFIAVFNTLEQIKANYLNGNYNNSQEHRIQLDNSIQKLCDRLSNITGKSFNDIYISMCNYLLNNN